ncbi:uncharacterized protein LOC143023959 [Oratosquilla oratoria]|uniref:uncharacterized protein LOC143023959 n=1 Tax=Oratosquilla oratoria TaxID=337810 RepID=UPI003F7767A0
MATTHDCGFQLIPQPPYSPDLAPSNFHLFPNLKKNLAGRRFTTDDEVMDAVDTYLQDQDSEFHNRGIKALQHRWRKCSDFLEILRDSPPVNNTIIASLDEENLFTNVPINKNIDFILKRVYHNTETKPLDIPEKTLKELSEISTKEAPFTLPSRLMYKQIDGVAMGSSLGVLFANFYTGTIETEVLTADWPSIYCRYVDDIFVQVKDPDELQDLRRQSITASDLNFTYEEDNNGHLPFLDVLVAARIAGFLTTRLCQKGPSPLFHLGSNPSRNRVTQVLVNNRYNNSHVSHTIQPYLNKPYNNKNDNTANKNSIKIYYKIHMSTEYKSEEKIVKDIQKNVQPIDPTKHIQIMIYYRTKKTAQLIICIRPNTTKTPLQEDHVVYQYNCNSEECGSHSYIGMTTTKLTMRLTCHLSNGP